ncbi:hypothetical protein ACIQ9P_03655 [Kitasatospora sp. NPDC094019]|uniref:hypothetical protein n=1 Tax=Kitasatospora sp. NPDC094019 TaxID=3364091 RepID=UPI00381FDBF9
MSFAAPSHERRVLITAGTLAGSFGTIVLARRSPSGQHYVLLDAGVNRGPYLYGGHEITRATPNALLITDMGTTRVVNLPADEPGRRAEAEHHLGGTVSIGPDSVTCVHGTPVIGIAVRADSSTLPVNGYADAVIDVLQHRGLARSLRGPVLLMGPADGDGRTTDLRPQQYEAIEQFVKTMRAEIREPREW